MFCPYNSNLLCYLGRSCSQQCNGRKQSKMHPDTEAAMSKQINSELYASYVYLTMASYFGRDVVALPGCRLFFMCMAQEEQTHAQCLIDYQNMRGGTVEFCSINAPPHNNWRSPLVALELALELEDGIRQSLEMLHQMGEKEKDYSLCDLIVSRFIQEQVRSQNELQQLITTMRRLGDTGIAIHLFDLMLHSEKNVTEFSPLNIVNSKVP